MAALDHLVLVWLGANSTTAGMVFLVLVVWSATQAGIVLSLYIAVLCALSFDYFFLPPVSHLGLLGAQAWVAMVSFARSCLVVSRVAERRASQTLQAKQRQADVERLYALSQEMMLYDDADRLIRDLPGVIDRIFALDGVVLYVCDRDQFYSSTGDVPISMQAALQPSTQGPKPHPRAIRRLPDHGAHAWAEAGGSVGLAARRRCPARSRPPSALRSPSSLLAPSPLRPQPASRPRAKASACAQRSSTRSPTNCAPRSPPSAPPPPPA